MENTAYFCARCCAKNFFSVCYVPKKKNSVFNLKKNLWLPINPKKERLWNYKNKKTVLKVTFYDCLSPLSANLDYAPDADAVKEWVQWRIQPRWYLKDEMSLEQQSWKQISWFGIPRTLLRIAVVMPLTALGCCPSKIEQTSRFSLVWSHSQDTYINSKPLAATLKESSEYNLISSNCWNCSRNWSPESLATDGVSPVSSVHPMLHNALKDCWLKFLSNWWTSYGKGTLENVNWLDTASGVRSFALLAASSMARWVNGLFTNWVWILNTASLLHRPFISRSFASAENIDRNIQ